MRASICALVIAVLAGPGRADPDPDPAGVRASPAPPPAATDARAPAVTRLPTGLAVGLELGEPTAATVRWAAPGGRLAANLAVGSGTITGPGLAMRAGLDVTAVTLHGARRPHVPIRVGVGVRHARHGYAHASVDELDDAHTGVYGSLAVAAVLSRHLELYVEAAPGYDLHRTSACSLRSGVGSVCPHAQTRRGFVDVVAGLRWYLAGG